MSLTKKIIFIFTFLLFGGVVNIYSQADKKTTISFSPIFGKHPLVLDQYYMLGNNDSLKIENLKFYISSIEFLNEDVKVFSEENSFHLLDVAVSSSMNIYLNLPEDIHYDQIKFNVGIDSITNVSGALGGDLDPTKGMYWTWQSGYINLKLEGKSNLCNTRYNEFSFHLGGYQTLNSAMQTIYLPVTKNNSIRISIDLQTFFQQIDLKKQNQLMSPGAEAISLSKLIVQAFKIQ